MNGPADGIADRLVLEVSGVVKDSAIKLPSWLEKLAGIAAAVVTSLAAVTYASAATADAAIKAARAAGISVEEYTALAHAAHLAGVNAEQLAMASRTVAITLSGAAKGAAEYADAYRELGIDAAAAVESGATFADLLPQIIDGLNRVPEPTRRTALAMKVLGEAGAKMASLVEGGGDALRTAMAEAREFGIVIGEDAAKASESLNDNTARLVARLRGLALTFGLRLVPAFDRAVLALGRLMDAIQPSALWALETAADAVTAAIDAMLTPVGRVVTLLGVAGLAGVAALSATKIAALAAGIPLVGGALSALIPAIAGVTLAAAPWIAAIVAAGLVLQDLYVYLNGGESVIGAFAESVGLDSEIFTALSSLKDLLVGVKDAFVALFTVAGEADEWLASKNIPLLSAWARAAKGDRRPGADGGGMDLATDAQREDAAAERRSRDLRSLALGAQIASRPFDFIADPQRAADAAARRVLELEARRREQRPFVPVTPASAPNVSITVSGAQNPEIVAKAVKREIDRVLVEASGQVVGGVP